MDSAVLDGGVDAAQLARLEQLEAEEFGAPQGGAAAASAQVDTQDPQQPAAKTAGDIGKKPSKSDLPAGTPAAADPKAQPSPSDKNNLENGKTGQGENGVGGAKDKTDTQAGSKFAKDQVRRDTSWKALNAEKETVAQEKNRLEQERQTLAREREEWQVTQARERNKYTPEQYEQGAQTFVKDAEQLELQADGADARAAKFEDAGEDRKAQGAREEARKLRQKAAGKQAQAEQAREVADHLRKNPEPTLQQVQAKTEEQRKQWTVHAAQKWPELAKDNSEFQQAVGKHLVALQQQSPRLMEHPEIIYHVARLVAAETAAARVPAMETELGGLRAKVKELEALTAPGGGSEAAAQLETGPKQLSDEEEEAELRRMAVAGAR